jgi:hypothetical protein
MQDTSPERLEQQGIDPATPLAADEHCAPYEQPHESAAQHDHLAKPDKPTHSIDFAEAELAGDEDRP